MVTVGIGRDVVVARGRVVVVRWRVVGVVGPGGDEGGGGPSGRAGAGPESGPTGGGGPARAGVARVMTLSISSSSGVRSTPWSWATRPQSAPSSRNPKTAAHRS